MWFPGLAKDDHGEGFPRFVLEILTQHHNIYGVQVVDEQVSAFSHYNVRNTIQTRGLVRLHLLQLLAYLHLCNFTCFGACLQVLDLSLDVLNGWLLREETFG